MDTPTWRSVDTFHIIGGNERCQNVPYAVQQIGTDALGIVTLDQASQGLVADRSYLHPNYVRQDRTDYNPLVTIPGSNSVFFLTVPGGRAMKKSAREERLSRERFS